MDGGEKRLLAGELRKIAWIAEEAEDALLVERKDLGLSPGVNEGFRRKAEFGQDVGGKRPGGRSDQLRVRWASGRSSEKAGIWMENISPCSFCIW